MSAFPIITPSCCNKASTDMPQILEWAFGKRMTPAERLRKNQRLLDKAIRELDQQRVKLEKQEKTLISQIRQSAQKGQMGACKIQAKDLVRTRRSVAFPGPRLEALLTLSARFIEKFYGMRSQLQKISLRLQVGSPSLTWRQRPLTDTTATARHTVQTSR